MSILIVEDDRINAFIVQKFLSGHYNSLHVVSGDDALNILEKEKCSLVLMDINLGDGQMDGIEVMKRIRQKPDFRELPIIATTAYAMSGDRDLFIEAGFDDYLPKPITRDDLLSRIEQFKEK